MTAIFAESLKMVPTLCGKRVGDVAVFGRPPESRREQVLVLGIFSGKDPPDYFPDLSIFYSNFWLIFGKLWEACSRLYRRRFLQLNTRVKALDEIYQIYTLLDLLIKSENHEKRFWQASSGRKTQPPRKNRQTAAPNSKTQLNFIKHFRMFAVIFSKFHLCLASVVQKSSILMQTFRNYNIISATFTETIKIS